MFFLGHSVYVYDFVFCVQREVSLASAGDNVNNVLQRHRAAVKIQRWFRLLPVRRRQCGQQASAEISAAGKGEYLLRRWWVKDKLQVGGQTNTPFTR